MSPLSSPLEAQDGVRCGYARAGAQNEERNIDQEIVVANTGSLAHSPLPARPLASRSKRAAIEQTRLECHFLSVRPSAEAAAATMTMLGRE